MYFELSLLFVTLIICYYYVQAKSFRTKMPPGEYGWPIFGRIPSRYNTIHFEIEKYRKKYGNVFTWKIGSVNFVVLCDIKSVKAAFSHPDLQDRPANFYTLRTMTLNRMIGIINGMGNPWQNVRRFSIRHLRNMGMGKTTMEDAINTEIEGLVKDFKKYNSSGPTEIPLSINAAVVNVLWRLIAGKTFDIESTETQTFIKALSDVFNASQSHLLLYDVLPWMVYLTPTAFQNWFGFKQFREDIASVFQLLKSVVDQHKKSLNMNEEPRDLVEAYLQEMENYRQTGKGEYGSTFNDEELLALLLDMFAAGSDTTSHTIRWILLYLAKYPEVQRRVQQEIDSKISRDKLPKLTDKINLPYSYAAYHEVLRVMPQAPLSKYHAAGADTKFLNHFVAKGTVLVSSIISCHLDPEYWEDPLEFRPERFLNEDGSFNGKTESFIPFSIGKRICIGESLAKMEVFLVTSALLQNFTFSAPEGETLTMEADPTQPLFNIPKAIKVDIKYRE